MATTNLVAMPGGLKRRRAVAALAAAVACATLAGCGTTVAGQRAAASIASPAPAAQLEFGSSGSGLTVPGSSHSEQSTVGSSAAGDANVGSGVVGSSAAFSGPTDAATADTSQGHGGEHKPFKVGLIYSTSTQAALAAVGSHTNVGDWQADGNAVIDYINAHGGVGGRKLMGDWYNANAQDEPNTVSQKACDKWTQDDHVDAAVPGTPIADMNVMRDCLGSRATPAISSEWHIQTRQQQLATSPLWVEPLAFPMESFARTYVDGLAAQGFFDGGKLGILYDQGPDWSAVEQSVLEPQLSLDGVRVAAKASYALRGFGDVGSAQPALNAAVLRFKAAGVNRVISFEPWVGWGFFMLDAQQQGYDPTFGLSSQTAWEVSYATGLVPEQEMRNAYYVGWSPVLDLPKEHVVSWPRLRLCRAILRNGGIRSDGQIADIAALSFCDGLLDLAAAGDAVHGDLTPSTYARALGAIDWQSAFIPSIRVSRLRPFGVTATRPGRWHPSCHCFAYSGPAKPITP